MKDTKAKKKNLEANSAISEVHVMEDIAIKEEKIMSQNVLINGNITSKEIAAEQRGVNNEYSQEEAGNLRVKEEIIVAYTCFECNQEFMEVDDLQAHLKAHEMTSNSVVTGFDYLECDACEKRVSIEDLQLNCEIHNYISETQQIVSMFLCESCGLSSEPQDRIKFNSKIVHSTQYFSCEKCSNLFDTKIGLLEHASTHFQLLPMIKNCGICKLVTKTTQILESHKIFHPNQKPFECVHCQRNIKILNLMKNHHSKASKRSCICQKCDMKFTRFSDWKLHQKEHEAKDLEVPEVIEDVIECVQCDKRFESRIELKSHQRIHYKYVCDYCGRYFKTKSNVATHIRIHLIKHQRHNCVNCDATYKSRQHLLRHQASHFKVECHICHKFFNSDMLSRHLRKHLNDKVYKCESCHYSFRSEHLLEVHAAIHNTKNQKIGPSEYRCFECNVIFKTEYRLKKHQLSHYEESLYKCDQCRKIFKTEINLKHHMRAHSWKKPFKCNACTKCFKTKLGLALHSTQAHAEFKCDNCKRVFKKARHLKLHQKSHIANGFVISCEGCNRSFVSENYLKKHLPCPNVVKLEELPNNVEGNLI